MTFILAKDKSEAVFNRIYCCYGNLLSRKNDHNLTCLWMFKHLLDTIIVVSTDLEW